MRRGIEKERLENERCQRKETQNLDERQDISADTCLPQGPMCYESTGVCVRDAQNETRLIFSIFWFGKPPHTHRYARACPRTPTPTHIYPPSGTEFLFSSLSPPTRRTRSQWKLQKQHLICRCFFFSLRKVGL